MLQFISFVLENSKEVSSISVNALLEDINSINLSIAKLSIGLQGGFQEIGKKILEILSLIPYPQSLSI